jgi:hypothetical protein
MQAQYLTSDPGYMSCKNAGCGERDASGACTARTCAAKLTFHVVNFRTDVEFVLFSGGFKTPCLLKRSGAIRFAKPASPLYGHLSSTDSKATSVSRAHSHPCPTLPSAALPLTVNAGVRRSYLTQKI